MRVYILTPSVPGGPTATPSPEEAIDLALRQPGWYQATFDLKGGITPTFFHNFVYAILPRWPVALVNEYAINQSMRVTVVEFEDDEYQSFIARIHDRSDRRTAPRPDDE